MARLVLSFNGDIIKDYELDKEVVTIGRKSSNDIHLDNLAVSGNHAKILTILNDSFIEDLASTNGTFVEGNKINKHPLKHGENIVIGKHELKFINGSNDEEESESEFEQTMIIRSGTQGMPEAKGANASEPAEADHEKLRPAKLQLTSGANAGEELQLTKILTTLGKPGVQVAAISRRSTGYFIIIVDSGKDDKMPVVNGEEVGKQHPLADGDAIEIAGVEMRFSLV